MTYSNKTAIGLSYSEFHLSQLHTSKRISASADDMPSCDGDLCSSQHQSASDALYTFEIDSPQRGFMQLPEKLHLGVGDKGIIGRRISVMTGSTQQPLTLAEGILGWN